MLTIAIDTSNTTLSIALVEDNQILYEIIETTKNDHSRRLMPAIDRMFKQTQRFPKDLDLISVAKGPGSYTGVRIGVTVAKTLAWTLKKPLVGVSSLEILARNLYEEGYVVPLFDARRQSVFAGVYDGKTYESVIADGHYDLSQLLEILSKKDKKIYFLGNDVVKYWEVITQTLGNKAIKVEDADLNIPHASILAQIAVNRKPVNDIHHFCPTYNRLPEAEVNWLAEQKIKE